MQEDVSLTLSKDEQRWLVYFTLSSSLLLTFILVSNIPQLLKYNNYLAKKKRNSKDIQRLLENPLKKAEKEIKYRVYLSNRDAKAKGKLTKNKGFEAVTAKDDLQFSKIGKQQNQKVIKKQTKKMKSIKVNKTESFQVKLFKKALAKKKGFSGRTTWGQKRQTTIPDTFKFRRRFAFSFDRNGEPQIPTRYYKHYDYFRKMSRKIGAQWAPPGGLPYPIFGDAYHSMSPTPGTLRYRAFPVQRVQVVFSLDKNGNLKEVKLWE